MTVAVLLFAQAVHAESGEADPLFQSNEILQVTFEGPLTTLIDEKSKEDYLDGKFSVVDADGSTLELDVKFRARGNFRHDNCDYPPVRLNFRKSQTKDTLFDKQDKLKLVVHCSRRAEYHQIVLQEYLAYRIFNVLTELSMRVRLLRITYVDTMERGQSEPRYAFLIEHKDRTAKRISIKGLSVERTQIGLIDSEHLNLSSMFQFFIGNTDFSPVAGAPDDDCCHNYILFQNPGTKIIAIPYDFDQSGFVDAPYANANPKFKLRSVRQRLYRGRCFNNDYVEGSIQQFLDHRDEIYSLIATQSGFEEETREDLVKFVDKFYDLIAEPKRVERTIFKKCI
jgi:hypothetical protein